MISTRIKYWLSCLVVIRAKIVLKIWYLGIKAEIYYFTKVFPGMLCHVTKALVNAHKVFRQKLRHELAVQYSITERDLNV